MRTNVCIIILEVLIMKILDDYRSGKVPYMTFHNFMWKSDANWLIEKLGYEQYTFYLYAGPNDFYENLETKLRVLLTVAPPDVKANLAQYLNDLLSLEKGA